MKSALLYPSKEEANSILTWASKQNPGPWVAHCKNVAKTAETIAQACSLNPERAYVSGLLHDIGYYSYCEGKGPTCHIYAGYELMKEKGFSANARICLTHSFPYQDIRAYGGSDMNCTKEELAYVSGFLSSTEYDDYDKLIQLSDCLATAQGICTMEKRMIDVVMRHGIKEFTISRWESTFALKRHFSKMCDTNIYNLFRDELIADVFE